MRKLLGLALVTGLATSQAWATPYIATSEPEPPLRRTEMHLGMLVGNSDIGDVSGPGVGFEVNVGRRFGDLTLLGQLAYMGVGESRYQVDARRGELARVGLIGRYSMFDIAAAKPLAYDFWIEAGGGRQRVSWEQGGTLTRNDLTLGLGMHIDATIEQDGNSPSHLGPFFALRFNLARAPSLADDSMPTCGGPCDTATTPSSNDISVFFHAGMYWGR